MGHAIIRCNCGEDVMESGAGNFECDRCGAEWINGRRLDAKSFKVSSVKKLKVVWSDSRGNWHHDFEITGGDPVSADGVMVAHVTEESMKELLDADRTEDL